MSQLRIMSNNLWRRDENMPDWEKIGGDCSSEHRTKGFLRVYQETSPDLLGLQECSHMMVSHLMELFSQNGLPYGLVWGGDTPILYRQDKFELLDSTFAIYNEAVPGYPGSFNNSKSKSYCIAVFRSKEDGKTLVFATTHLWYRSGDPQNSDYQPYSEEARHYQLNLVMDQVDKFQKKYRCPAVVVGDLNAFYDSITIQSALQRGYQHAHKAATEYADDTSGMHECGIYGFNRELQPGGFAKSIDHILFRDTPKNFVLRFQRYLPDYYFPLSDHSPVWIDAVL